MELVWYRVEEDMTLLEITYVPCVHGMSKVDLSVGTAYCEGKYGFPKYLHGKEDLDGEMI